MPESGGSPKKGRVTFREVLGVSEFRALWLAELTSQAGDQMARVALSVLVYQATNSAALTGLTYALTFAPSLLGGIILPGIADRFPRRNVMAAVDAVRALLILLVAFPGMPFAGLWVLVGLVSFLNPLFKAAQISQLPDILTSDQFLVGMALRNITMQTAQLAGFLGGGLLITVINPRIALALDAATFLASALLVRFGIKFRPAPAHEANERRQSFLASIGVSAKAMFADRGLRTLCFIIWLMAFSTVYEGLAAPYAAAIGAGTIAVGFLLASDPLGSVIGAWAYSRWVPERVRPRTIGLVTVLCPIPLLFAFLSPNIVLSCVLFVIAGAFGTVAVMQATASYTLAVPDSRRAQMIGLSNTGLSTASGFSPFIGGIVADQVGSPATVGWFGLGVLILGGLLALLWHRVYVRSPERWTEREPSTT
ncbi:MFS transporter [Tenggerimyces flavus]|uniref:MFS transporter n=1 Tax=Tenggerimyces flavus TaxID=1708749 RepID=A0ABV7YJL8_9ACTN|nr:MFS transporter [Tenggerimyces flavus]MBM7784039.1 MFS family permease [Tenggerimyces flavus]